MYATIASGSDVPIDAPKKATMKAGTPHTSANSMMPVTASMATKYIGVDECPYHQPGDERVVMVVSPSHFTQMG